MKKTPLILIVSAMAIVGAGAIITPTIAKSPVEARALEGTHVSTWDALKDGVKKASDGQVFILDADITSSGSGSDRIKIDGKDNITIDLNGHTVNRNRTKSSEDGHAFEIQGDSTVTITNTSATDAFIVGGYAENGGGMNIHDGSTVTVSNINFHGNKASNDGGAIQTKGTLIIDNCVFRQNESSDDGGAIYACGKSRFEITESTFVANVAKNDGGAIDSHTKHDSNIRNCTFQDNKSRTEDGGAINHEADTILSLYDSYFSHNDCEDYGGAVNLEDGALRIYGCSFYGNNSDYGGAVYVDDSLEIFDYESPTIMENNYASTDGGAIYNNKSNATIGAITIRNNSAKKSGGGMFLKGGTTTLNGTIFLENKTQQNHGGAVAMYSSANLTINGGEYTNNTAMGNGGAVFADEDAKNPRMQGAIVMYQNGASNGSNLYLDGKRKIDVTGSLEGSTIGVSMKKVTGEFTNNYPQNNLYVEPSNYFVAPTGYVISGPGGTCEAQIEEGSSGGGETPVDPQDPYNLFPFVGKGNLITDDLSHLGGNNWMKGISGTRYINEINIPGTHDTSMREIGTEAGALSVGGVNGMYAITQKRYIPEQYEEGVRYVDIRLNNRVVVEENTWTSYTLEDDGKNLWTVHGKKAGGTYWACDPDGNLITLNMVLDYTREFLERNPSETIIMGFSDETYYDSYIPTIYERLLKIITEYEAAHPGIFYLENNDFTARYSHLPRLNECRGQIVIEVKGGHGIGGINRVEDYVDVASQDTDYHVSWDDKRDDVNKFFSKSAHQISVPQDGGAWEHEGTLFKIGLNCAPQTWTGIPWFTPLYHASGVIEDLFYKEKGAFYDIQGKYVGWIKTDGATEKEWGRIWRSNFVQTESDYVTVTVDPNLNDPNYQIKQYTLLKNSSIKVPSFNYDFDEESHGLYFLGWKVGEETYFSGADVVVSENMTFSASWTDSIQVKNAVIDVVFEDCDDVDGLRPTQIDLQINGSTTITLTSMANWHYLYGGKIASIVPDWSLIKGGGHGTDAADSYRYEVSGDAVNGYVVHLIHTNRTIMTQFHDVSSVHGRITWDDNSDWDRVRPTTGAVQVGLIPVGGEEFVENSLVSPYVSGDSNVWEYDISNTSVPKYFNGQEAQYEVALKFSDSWLHSQRYNFDQDGLDFTGLHSPKKVFLAVRVRWADNQNPNRPESLKVHLLGEGNEIDVQSISGTDSSWISFFTVNFFHKAVEYAPDNVRVPFSSYSIAITDNDGNPVEGYQTPVITQDGRFYDVLFMKEGFDMTAVDAVNAQIDALGDVTYTPEYKTALDAARASYEALDSAEKSLVTDLAKLQNLEMEYADKFAARIAVDEEIAEVCAVYMTLPYSEMADAFRHLFRAFLDLSEEERNSLWYYSDLNTAITNIGHIAAVYDMIDELGDAQLTDEYKSALDAARAAYDALTDEQKSRIDNYDELVLLEADYFAKNFIALTDTACGTGAEGDDHSAALDAVWGDLSLAWDALSDEAKAILKEGLAEDAIEDFYARYSHIVGRYGQDYVFADGPTVQQVGYHGASSGANLTMPIALAVVLTISTLATGALFLARRKRVR